MHLIIDNVIKQGKVPPQYGLVYQIVMKKTPRNNKTNKVRRTNKYKLECNLILKHFWPHKASVNEKINTCNQKYSIPKYLHICYKHHAINQISHLHSIRIIRRILQTQTKTPE